MLDKNEVTANNCIEQGDLYCSLFDKNNVLIVLAVYNSGATIVYDSRFTKICKCSIDWLVKFDED